MPLQYIFFSTWLPTKLIPAATRSKASVYGRSLAGILGSNNRRRHWCLSLVSVVYCQLEVYAMTDPSSGGVLSSVISKPQHEGGLGPSRAVCATKIKKYPWSNLLPPPPTPILHNVLSCVTPLCLAQTRTELHLDTYIIEGFVAQTDSHFEHRNESRWLQMLE